MANKIKKFFQRLLLSENTKCELNIVSQPVFESFRELEVIVFKVDFLGDFVLAIPALVALKEKLKSEKIDIVVGEWNVGLARRTGLFRTVYVYNGLARYEIAKEKLADEERTLQLELPLYDMAIEFRRGKDSKTLMSWVKATCKIGSNSYPGAKQSLDICLELVDDVHESLQMMRIVDAVPVRVFDLPVWGAFSQGTEQSKILSMFPFSGNPAKEWPLDQYVDLARKLVEQNGFDEIQVFCSLEESEKASAFAECRNVSVHSGLPAEELISILMGSNAVISNDSFGAHLASYLHIPLVVIYSGQSRSQEWQPSFGPMSIVRTEGRCARCNRTHAKSCAQKRSAACLQQIKTEDILGEINKIVSMADERKIKQNKVMLVG